VEALAHLSKARGAVLTGHLAATMPG
jgi:hypothetical protein